MAKKKNKIKKAPKIAKKAKEKLLSKKAKPANSAKKTKAKSAKYTRPASGKVAKKIIVKKKISDKKSIKTASKKNSKKESKITKPIKGLSTKSKEALKSKSEKINKTAKPVLSKFDAKPLKKKKANNDDDFFDEEQEPKKLSKRRKKKAKGDDDDDPVILDDILVEQIIKSTKRQPKAPKVPKILKTFTNPMASLSLPSSVPGKKGGTPQKEPKGKFELEYVVRTSSSILYELLTTPSGLSEWFSDDVNIRDGVFTFFWDGSEQKARLLGFKDEQYIRLQWIDKPEGYYFEFRIQKDELTGDISLIITDFADEASDMETSKLLWDSQVNKLLNVLGSN